jgi:hypothetical protein
MNVRLRGHGVLVIPKAKFRFERDVIPVASDDVEVLPAPSALDWRIETSGYSIAWPKGFAIADDPDELSPFLLHGARDALIWIAGPLPRDKVLPIEKLAADDQRVRAIADAGDAVRIDIDYALPSESGPAEHWWQRRYVRMLPGGSALLLSAQALASDEDSVRAAIDAIDESLEVRAPS